MYILVVLGSIKDAYGVGTGRQREKKEQAQSHQEQEDPCFFVAVPLIARLVEYLVTRVTLLSPLKCQVLFIDFSKPINLNVSP